MTLLPRALSSSQPLSFRLTLLLALSIALLTLPGPVHAVPAGGPRATPGVIHVDLPSDSTGMPGGALALTVQVPSTARHPEGAPVLVYVAGGTTAGGLDPALQAMDDVVRIVFMFPGGHDPDSGRSSDGVYDDRGPLCIAALRDVLRYASGMLRDDQNRLLSDLTPVPVHFDNVGMVGASNGGNIVTAVLAHYGAELAQHVRYLIQWESPVSSQMATTDLGGLNLDCPPGEKAYLRAPNPRYGGYAFPDVTVDYGQLTYDPSDARQPVFWDGTGDGHYTTVLDGMTGCWSPDLNGDGIMQLSEDYPLSAYADGPKDVYSRPATQAMANQSTLGATWPGQIANPVQSALYWDDREAVRLAADTVAAVPDLEAMVLESLEDHVQVAPDHPHTRLAFEAWDSAGIWVQINPSRSYLDLADPSLIGRTDIPALPPNTPPADWLDPATYTIPEDVSSNALQIAAVWQMADRVQTAPPAGQPPILLTFNVHFDPVMGNFDEWRRQTANMTWLRGLLAGYPPDLRPYLNLQMQGDHAEFYLLPHPAAVDGRIMLQDLIAAGDSLGTHTHKSIRGSDPSSWQNLTMPAGGHPCTNPAGLADPPVADMVELISDHVTWIEQLYTVLGVVDPVAANGNAAFQVPSRFDNKALAFAGTLTDGLNTVPHAFGIETGGRNECFNFFFDHDVLTPWRLGPNGPLDEDLNGQHVMVPGLPDIGSMGTHYDMAIDASVPAYQRRFLLTYLQRLFSQHTGADSQIWTLGWHIHPHTLYDLNSGEPEHKKLREDVEEWVEWLNARFIGTADSVGNPVAEYATIPEVADAFIDWETNRPGQSAFEYQQTGPDLGAYPYDLTGLMLHTANAHLVRFLTPAGAPVQVAEMVRCSASLRGEGSGYWGRSPGGELICSDQPASGGHAQGNSLPTTTFYLAWRDAATPTAVNLKAIIGGPARVVDGVTGADLAGSLQAWPLDYRPVILLPLQQLYLPMMVKLG